MYEHTSVDQEKAAGESIVTGKLYQTEETSSSVAEPKPSLSTEKIPEIEKKPSSEKLPESQKKFAQQFSSLQNCTFNFYTS